MDINVACPDFVLPFSFDNIMNNECWVLNSGNLTISTYNYCKENESETKAYKIFDINLKDVGFNYYSSVQFYYQKSNQVSVVTDF